MIWKYMLLFGVVGAYLATAPMTLAFVIMFMAFLAFLIGAQMLNRDFGHPGSTHFLGLDTDEYVADSDDDQHLWIGPAHGSPRMHRKRFSTNS